MTLIAIISICTVPLILVTGYYISKPVLDKAIRDYNKSRILAAGARIEVYKKGRKIA